MNDVISEKSKDAEGIFTNKPYYHSKKDHKTDHKKDHTKKEHNRNTVEINAPTSQKSGKKPAKDINEVCCCCRDNE